MSVTEKKEKCLCSRQRLAEKSSNQYWSVKCPRNSQATIIQTETSRTSSLLVRRKEKARKEELNFLMTVNQYDQFENWCPPCDPVIPILNAYPTQLGVLLIWKSAQKYTQLSSKNLKLEIAPLPVNEGTNELQCADCTQKKCCTSTKNKYLCTAYWSWRHSVEGGSETGRGDAEESRWNEGKE